MSVTEPDETIDRGRMRSDVANAIVGLHARHLGRGPTRARTHIGDDFVLCLLEDVFTPAERTLVREGRGELVRRGRAALADALQDEFVGVVERVTGRSVRAYLSQVNLDPELATELFLLS